MRILKDFECISCGIVTEILYEAETSQIMCPDCGSDSVAMMAAPSIQLEGLSGAFPGAHNKWAKIREDNARIKASRA